MKCADIMKQAGFVLLPWYDILK